MFLTALTRHNYLNEVIDFNWSERFILYFNPEIIIKGTFMQIENALINDRVSVLKVFWKFRIPTIYNFAEFTSEIFYFLKK